MTACMQLERTSLLRCDAVWQAGGRHLEPFRFEADAEGGRGRRARSFKEDAEDDDVASSRCLSGSSTPQLGSSCIRHGYD